MGVENSGCARPPERQKQATIQCEVIFCVKYFQYHASVLVSQGNISPSEVCLARSAEHKGRVAYAQLAFPRKTRRAERAHHAEHGTVTRSVQRNAEARRQWSIHTTQSVQRVPWNAEITVEPSTHLAPGLHGSRVLASFAVDPRRRLPKVASRYHRPGRR